MKIKHILPILSLLFLFVSFAATAQTNWCGTDHTDEFMDRLTRNVKYANTHSMKMDGKMYIPTKFHLVADSDGNGRMPEESVYLQLCRMNQQYDSIGFVFFIEDGFNYIDNTAAFNHTGGAQSIMSGHRNDNPHSMNVFITNATHSDGVAGYYTPQFDYLVVRKSSWLDVQNGTLGHEAAHLFSISHPHYGWEDEPYTPEKYGETVTLLTISSSQSPIVTVEVMDDPDCDTVGDRICDTPPDYGFTQNGGSNFVCHNPWEGIVKDRNGVLIENITNLVMGYNGNCADIIFTEGQAEAMIADYNFRINSSMNTLGHMTDDYIPDTTQITESITKNFPESFSTTDYFDSVVFEWEPVTGAHQYLLRIGGDTNLEVIVDDTEYEITEFEADGTYTWNVYPINEIGYCTEGTANILFFTGLGSTAVNEIDVVSAFAVHPNPVTDNEMFVTIQSTQNLDAVVSMYNISGQSVLGDMNYKISTGKNILPIALENVASGLYHLYIRTEKGILSEKILVD